jgi:hypothetical protein
MTKKFVNALSKDDSAGSRSRFLVPARDGSTQFEELDTGKRHDVGYLVYTGKELSTEDVAKKWNVEDAQSEHRRRMIHAFLSEISRFKVGNVVAIEKNAEDNITLRLVSQTPKMKAGPGRQ